MRISDWSSDVCSSDLLADTLVDDFDVVELMTRLADGCVDVLDVGAAGLMLTAPDGVLHVMASSSEAMRVLELLELQADRQSVVSGKSVSVRVVLSGSRII